MPRPELVHHSTKSGQNPLLSTLSHRTNQLPAETLSLGKEPQYKPSARPHPPTTSFLLLPCPALPCTALQLPPPLKILRRSNVMLHGSDTALSQKQSNCRAPRRTVHANTCYVLCDVEETMNVDDRQCNADDVSEGALRLIYRDCGQTLTTKSALSCCCARAAIVAARPRLY